VEVLPLVLGHLAKQVGGVLGVAPDDSRRSGYGTVDAASMWPSASSPRTVRCH
jgi:hypothetical protein